MKTILEEYGTTIVVVLVIAALIAIVTILKSSAGDSIQGTFTQFSNNANNQVQSAFSEEPSSESGN